MAINLLKYTIATFFGGSLAFIGIQEYKIGIKLKENEKILLDKIEKIDGKLSTIEGTLNNEIVANSTNNDMVMNILYISLGILIVGGISLFAYNYLSVSGLDENALKDLSKSLIKNNKENTDIILDHTTKQTVTMANNMDSQTKTITDALSSQNELIGKCSNEVVNIISNIITHNDMPTQVLATSTTVASSELVPEAFRVTEFFS